MLGLGTAASPFIISTPEDFNSVRDNLSAYYELGNDIDMSEFGNFEPIGTNVLSFVGEFDGKGFKISNLTIIATVDWAGVFGFVRGGLISNLGIENIYLETSARIIGGLVGRLSAGQITNCYTTGEVKSININGLTTGGFVGENNGTIENCYSRCTVTGQRRVGGFAGYASGGAFRYCFSASSVKGTNVNETGGFYGLINTNSGFVPTFLRNHFDSTVAGTTNTTRSNVNANTTTAMKTQSTYLGWSWDTIWQIKDGEYPTLIVFNEQEIPTQKVTVEATSSTAPIVGYSKLIRRKVAISLTYTNEVSSTVSKQLTTACMSFVEEIVSSVRALKNTNIKTYEITSSLSAITGSSTRRLKAIRNIDSHIDLSASYVEVIITDNSDIPIYANVFYATNASKVSTETNVSTISSETNTSKISSETNTSTIFNEQNQSETSVI